ncbi:UDP-Glc:alpha-D-GlcNAc-diphosphoundecaprenol beta-1,3-glucosyltransferase WfgD [Gordonia insulae]|uniref:UDP-Glc:alpha-D-GlcNAc-diphosphoundecaprenol beta-1,3-glucosyltransferase WfgD n=2 Tax=Gordonia insulae TaxID=2420509 RepID=A0A3G8JM66_9ACTN|nr:UDP-Glc:alpha-D-GlcNAc-diphosphoundecaprenol beta-1,3-glucosyltransferase WfgD [Gordonia insulae]
MPTKASSPQTAPDPLEAAVVDTGLDLVVCCYTRARLHTMLPALSRAVEQLDPTDEVLVVVDHNEDLRTELLDVVPDRVRVIANERERGLSGARNTGLHAARAGIVVFLDDDATLQGDGLEVIRERFTAPDIVAVGGGVEPAWHAGTQPAWFPEEFGWVVGCDYRGLPADGADIRNPIGAAMAVRRRPLVDIGGFSRHLGRRGTFPAGCEETLMGIALRERHPGARLIRDTRFSVRHEVTPERTTLRYFVRRCYQEGRSKATLSALTSADLALASERDYTRRILTSALWRHRRTPARAAMVVVGFVTTVAGFAVGTIQNQLAPRARRERER